MDSTQHSSEVLFDFPCLFWDFINQWKAILVFSIIISMLVTGIKYKQDVASFEAAQAEQSVTKEEAEMLITSTLESLSNEDRDAVNNALNYATLIKEKLAYQNNSPLMKLDANKTEVLSLVFQVSGSFDQASASALDAAYLNTFNDDSTLLSISNSLSVPVDPIYLKELLLFHDPSVTLAMNHEKLFRDNGIMVVFIIVPTGEDCDAMQSIITDIMKTRCANLSKEIAPHSISLITSDSSISAVGTIQAKQTENYYSISAAQPALKNLLDDMSTTQPAAYSAYNYITNLRSIASGDSANSVELEKPGVSTKAMILGIFVGVLTYFFIFFVLNLFKERILSYRIAKKILHSRLIGEYYYTDNKPLSLFQKLISSKIVFNIRHKGKTDAESQACAAAQAIDIITSQEGIQALSLITTSSNDLYFANLVKNDCREKDLILDIIEESVIDDAQELKNTKFAIVAVSNKTTFKTLTKLVDLLDFYKINVLGFIYTSEDPFFPSSQNKEKPE